MADAVEIARRSRRLALQSAGIGTALSLLAMLAAAFGLLIPVAGAVVQEGIDVAVIVNALRALHGATRRRTPGEADRLLRRFAREHEELLSARNAVRQAADALSTESGPAADTAIRRAHRLQHERLLPHERGRDRAVPGAGRPKGRRPRVD